MSAQYRRKRVDQRKECIRRWHVLARLPRSLGLVLKALMQALWLLAMLLLWMPSPDVILLQVTFSRHCYFCLQWSVTCCA